MPATVVPSIPPPPPPAEAAEARDGRAPAEVTPLQRSAETLRAEAGVGVVLRVAARSELLEPVVDLTVARLGAVELANTDRPPSRATPAVAPLTRALTAPVLRTAVVVRAGLVERGAVVARGCTRAVGAAVAERTAPLVVADADCAGAVAAGALAGAWDCDGALDWAGGETGTGAGFDAWPVDGCPVDAGGAAGVAGVP